MASAFHAAFGTCRRDGYTKSYCYNKAKREMEAGPPYPPRKKRRKKKGKMPKKAGVSHKGSRCRRMTKVYSSALGKKVKRCTGGYTRGRR